MRTRKFGLFICLLSIVVVLSLSGSTYTDATGKQGAGDLRVVVHE